LPPNLLVDPAPVLGEALEDKDTAVCLVFKTECADLTRVVIGRIHNREVGITNEKHV
jgi:hypothetical protein